MHAASRVAKEQFVASNALGGNAIEVLSIFVGVAVLSRGGGTFWKDVVFVVVPLCVLCTVCADLFAWVAWILVGMSWLLQSRDEMRDVRDISTTYRGVMMLFTCVCILAVDFPVFPRRFGKTEEFGFSLMDSGVGLFVFSSGMFASGTRGISGSWKVIGLGVLRFVATWALDYHQHVTEYGSHWNFFITLGVVHAVCIGVLAAPRQHPLVMGVLAALLSVLYQLALSQGPLTEFLLHAPRISLFSHNREGLVSCLGFVAIFLFGVALKSLLRSPWPLFWVFLSFGVSAALTHLFWQEASRRMANLAYICFVVSGSAVVLLLLHLLRVKPGPVVRGISESQLTVFLVANVLTGLVNITVDTMNVSSLVALLILTVYSCFVSVIVPQIPAFPQRWKS